MSWGEVKYLQQNSGGLPPNDLSLFKSENGTVKWAGADTVIDGQVLCKLRKIVIRYSMLDYPKSPTDGELLLETTEKVGSYYHGKSSAYLTAFTFSDRNVIGYGDSRTQDTVVLEETSWSIISELSNSGELSAYFSVGDEKTVSINGTDYQAVIMDFNHDELTAGGTAGVTFGLKNCLTTTHNMNSSKTNSGGWSSCAMRSWLRSDVWGWLPSDLQNVIKTVNKKTSAGLESSAINTTEDNLFLLSEVEIFGSSSNSFSGEGTQYSYFTTESRRVKTSGDSGSATDWWERSPRSSIYNSFCYVGLDGSASGNGVASYSLGVSFGFCI